MTFFYSVCSPLSSNARAFNVQETLHGYRPSYVSYDILQLLLFRYFINSRGNLLLQ